MAIKRLRFLAVICIFSMFSFHLYSQNEMENDEAPLSLGYIDQLININDYTNALEQLSLYIQKYPDQFDKAQKRVSKILKVRNEFNLQASSLAEKMRISAQSSDLTDEQVDELDTQKMEIIMALENIEKNPAREEIDLTNDARRTVRLAYYINRSNLIVNQGTALINSSDLQSEENFVKAFEKFREGLNLKTSDSDIVFNGNEEIPVVYPDDLKKNVDRHIAQIKNFSFSVNRQTAECQRLYQRYLQAVEQIDGDGSLSALKDFQNAFISLAETRNKIYQEGNELKKLDEQALKLNPLLNDTSYITFSRWAVLGIESNPDSGMIGAIDAFCNTRIEKLKESVYSVVKKEFSQIEESLNLNGDFFSIVDYEAPSLYRQTAINFSQQALQVQKLYTRLDSHPAQNSVEYEKSMEFALAFAGNDLKNVLGISQNVAKQNAELLINNGESEKFEEYLKLSINRASFYESQLNATVQAKKSLLIQNERQRAVQLFQDDQQKNLENEFNELQIAEDIKRTTAGVFLKDEILDFSQCISLYDSVTDQTEKECIEKAGKVWSAIARTYSEDADSTLANLSLRNAEAHNLLNGIEEYIGDISIKKYYPTKASEECVKLNGDIQKNIARIQQNRNILDGGKKYSLTDENYASGVINIEQVLIALNELIKDNNSIISSAKIKANEAKKAANEARQKYEKSVALLKNNRYDDARQELSDADESFKRSLALEENENLRKEFSEKIIEADERITISQNEWVVTTVRSLLDDAYNEYYAGNFENSKRTLDEAGEIWEKTQAQENTEITGLLVLVKDALESTDGKEIAYSDPLYKDMGAYLSNARIHYEEGYALIKKGSSEEGVALLNTARDEVRKVQRVFPKNLEANNLNLLINRELDPDIYKSTVAQKLSQVRTVANSGKDTDMKNALNDLKDLQKIIPENKDVAAAVIELEKAVARAAQSEKNKKDRLLSEQLTKQAQAEKNIDKKLALLNQALNLNRQNTVAQRLKDQINIKNAAKTTVKNYLDPVDEIKLAQAERYYNDGLRDQAIELITQLYAKNPNVYSVIKLKSRIENM